MVETSLGLLAAILVTHAVLAQQPALPVLRANATTVDVQDGDRLWKGVWSADPAIAMDVYYASRTTSAKRVTFITDIESMSFETEPGRTYDFIILLNGKDACRTRLSTMVQSAQRVGTAAPGPVSIPFTISGGKLHLHGKINGSESLDIIFDTGADTIALYPSATKKGCILRFDGTVSNSGTGGTTVRQTSSDNRLEIAGLRWEHEPVLYIEKQADKADGIVGYRVFEDKAVEIDYDRMVLVVHESLPAHAAEFARTAILPFGSLTAVEAALVNGTQRASGPFVIDTGGTGTLMVNQSFAAAHGLRGTMQHLGTSTSRGVGSGAVRNEVVLLPELSLAGFTLANIPIHVEEPSDVGAVPPSGTLCVDVLRRFNTILDYPHNAAYLKPNTHFNAPFPSRGWSTTAIVASGIAAVLLAVLVAWVVRRTSSRRAATQHLGT